MCWWNVGQFANSHFLVNKRKSNNFSNTGIEHETSSLNMDDCLILNMDETIFCANLIVSDFHTSLSYQEIRMLTMMCMNVSLMEYMRTEYDNLHSLNEASETRISKDLRDKAEVQAREDTGMQNR